MGKDAHARVNVLFVCTGNICRSPTADGVFRTRIAADGLNAASDSAGMQAYHVGEAPDERSTACASRYGVDLTPLRARQVTRADFDAFDLILAMDRGHLGALNRMNPGGKAEVALFMKYAGADGVDVPDPYYGGDDGFERVYRMIERGVDGLTESVRG